MLHLTPLRLSALALSTLAACSPDELGGGEGLSQETMDDPTDVPATAMGEPVVGDPPAMVDAGASAMAAPEAGAAASDSAEEPEAPEPSGPPMTFFVSSEGKGTGGDLGGLSGADEHCQRLANLAGVGDRTWQAMLSTEFVDARSRIGEGPWHNHAGVLIGESVDAMFERGIRFGAERTRAMLDEYGEPVPSSSHDILSGSDDVGVRVVGGNCVGWTSNAAFDAAIVGHSDSSGAQGNDPDRGWVAAHLTTCSQAGLVQDGGDARMYCFAID